MNERMRTMKEERKVKRLDTFKGRSAKGERFDKVE
jgi:hypothetical protein